MFKFGLLELRQMHLGHTMEQDMTGMEWNGIEQMTGLVGQT